MKPTRGAAIALILSFPGSHKRRSSVLCVPRAFEPRHTFSQHTTTLALRTYAKHGSFGEICGVCVQTLRDRSRIIEPGAISLGLSPVAATVAAAASESVAAAEAAAAESVAAAKAVRSAETTVGSAE